MRSKTVWGMSAGLAAVLMAGGAIAAAATPSTQGALSAAAAQQLSTNVSQKVIVVMKDQVPNLSAAPSTLAARKNDVRQVQQPVLSELSATSAQDVQPYTAVNAVSATVSPGEADRLENNPAVAQVIPDRLIPLGNRQTRPSAGGATGATPLPGSCPNGNKVQLEPEALVSIRADSDDPTAKTARALGFTGAGVKVGFIADGLDINNVEFIRKNGEHVFTDYKDFSGEGTGVPTGGGEAFLDAGSIAAQGNTTYDVSKYSKLPLNRPCKIRIEGVAPGVSLVGLSIFGAEDAGFNSSFLQAIDYAVTVSHVNVLNESLGINAYPDDQAGLDLIKSANDAAVAAGVTVTVSSGDAGVTTTIGSPATDPNVLSVGASTTYRFDAQTGYAGGRFPGVNGWISGNISSLSSGGYSQRGATVDLVAPGELNWGPCSTNVELYEDCTSYAGDPSPVQPAGGTSESAPLTAGVAALIIEAYAKTHSGAKPTPAQVKQILTSTADDIQAPADQQGAGEVDAYQAVLLAQAYGKPTTTKKPTIASLLTPGTITTSVGQFNQVDAPGSTQTLKETLTNSSARPQLVSLSSRALGPYSSINATNVTLSDTASPHLTDFQGYSVNYQAITFTVPRGADRLKADIAYQGASTTDLAARVRLTLIDPTGKLAGYSLPQGIGNYGDSQVANPAPGRWTAYVYSRGTADGGTAGPVVFGAGVSRFTSFGKVSPSAVYLGPGQSAPVTLTVKTPTTPGDTSGALLVRQLLGGSGTSTVPVTLRSLAPAGPTTFPGVLTGGNGRGANTGQADYYQVDLPGGLPEFNASVTLADNPNNQVYAWLIDPSGNAAAFASNDVVTSDDDGNAVATNTLAASLHALNPAAGRWTVIVLFAPQVSGTALSEPYSVHLDQDAVPASAPGLPNSADTALPAGVPQTVNVTVKNTSTAPESYFVDGRLNTTTQLELAGLSGNDTTVPFTFNSNFPTFVVPTNTTQLDATATTTGGSPIQFDLGTYNGDPDIGSGVGKSVSATYSANPVPQGPWGLFPNVVGAFGSDGVPTQDVSTTLTATTKAFDPAVTTEGGDLWQTSVDPNASFGTVIVQPGDTATIPVTITPNAPAGTVVSGTLYVDDASLIDFGSLVPNGNQVAALPYTYTVK